MNELAISIFGGLLLAVVIVVVAGKSKETNKVALIDSSAISEDKTNEAKVPADPSNLEPNQENAPFDNSDIEDVNWFKVLDWVIFMGMIFALFYFLNENSKGEFGRMLAGNAHT